MFILEICDLKKYFGERLILNIDSLKVYDNDKIGIVGLNGAGKTTFLNLLTDDIQPDEGTVHWYGTYEHITQFERLDSEENAVAYLSGGEKTQLKITKAFKKPAHMLLADEPTSNLDMHAIDELHKKLFNYDGSMLLISHDRGLLNKVCNKIIEIENGKLNVYAGNYEKYRNQKKLEQDRLKQEYDLNVAERKRLENTMQHAKERVNGMRHTPRRMGNSEARLHKNGTKSKKNAERFVKHIESRIEDINAKLSPAERPKEPKKIKINIHESGKLVSKFAVECHNIEIRFGNRIVLEPSDFVVRTGSKTALLGRNGAGKTTLVKMILNSESGIRIAESARIAYFAQDLSILNEQDSILKNVADSSAFNESHLRTMLARLGFRRDDVHKKVSVISGGEKVKVSLAKIFASDVNMLVLDEPTNYLDIFAQEALEEMMGEYEGTILFITHDRELVEKIADSLLIIEDSKLSAFDGSMEEYSAKQAKKKKNDANSSNDNLDGIGKTEKLLMLENRLSYVTGRLSVKSKTDDMDALDAEFKKLVAEINDIKKLQR